MTTELGYDVPLNDWWSFHRDRILSVLFQMRQQGVPAPGFQTSMIGGVTGLPEPQALELATGMVTQGFLSRDGLVYRLTPAGVDWVMRSPRR